MMQPAMQFWIGMTLGAGIGYGFRNRRNLQSRLIRKLQLIATRRELKAYRLKGRRPAFSNWARFWLGWLHRLSPHFTRYMSLSPATLIRWHRRFCTRWWAWKSRPHSADAKRGRPCMPKNAERLVLAIHADNPGYGAERIAAILTTQLGIKIAENTVRKILKKHVGATPPPSRHSWQIFLHNHRLEIASMDFKSTFDWRGRQVFILNIIDHARRRLLWSRASYHPDSGWVSQQLREAFGWENLPLPKYMVMDNDSTFLPVAKFTLPNMGIQAIRTAIRSPWQNAIVERFNRTLDEELLAHVIPMGEKHLNKLLAEYRDYYNHGRPHQANGGQSPVMPRSACNDASFTPGMTVEKIPWLNGLHHSYRLAA